jgi:hypothetical membrane protein
MTTVSFGWRHANARRRFIRDLPFAAGVVSSLVYVTADLLCGLQYVGYSFTDQVISELSAIGAPTASLWGAMLSVYAVLLAAFTAGVLCAAGDNQRLRRTGWLLVAFVLSGPLWSFVPMHRRGEEFTWTDAGHIALGGGTVLLLTSVVGMGAGALGRRFRRYSIATMTTIFVAGIATFGYVGRMMAQQPTPGAGVVERISLYAFLLWIGVLATSLRQHDVSTTPRGASRDGKTPSSVPGSRPTVSGVLSPADTIGQGFRCREPPSSH